MPTVKNGTVVPFTPAQQPVPHAKPRRIPPKRLTNAARRPREHLTPAEVEILRHTAKSRGGRYGERDALAILVMYRHGLRVIELRRLTRPQVDFKDGVLHGQPREERSAFDAAIGRQIGALLSSTRGRPGVVA